MKLIVRNIHKYLSFFISVQLLLWTVSGIYFAFNKIELVRGEQYRLTNFSDINLGEIDFDIPKTSNLEIKKRLDKTILILSSDSGSSYLKSDGTPLDKISGEMAMLLPIILGICQKMDWNPSKFLIPLSFASILGGMNTKIGTPPNIIISEFRNDFADKDFAFFDFSLAGVPVRGVVKLNTYQGLTAKLKFNQWRK